jgi:hypothetical protein
MKIKVKLDMAYSEPTMQESAANVATRFGVLVEIVREDGPGGSWPEVAVIGTPAQVVKMMTSEGGWSSGSDEDDAEALYYALREATPVFG